jgi:pyruvate, water dikinase
MSGHTRALSDLERADEPEFGGKSAGLGELLSAGLPVPPGFALACSAFELAGRGAPVPEVVRRDVGRAYDELGSTTGVAEPPVAVRSSAIGEDSAEATFAGQQESVLWVRGADRVCEAIGICWASLFSPTAIAYRARLSAPPSPVTMGVAVQMMVDAAVAGVLFTCNPVSGDRSMVAINASWGLGVAVVGGEVTPDDYLISKVTGELVREQVGTKAVEYLPAADGQGTMRIDVPPERRRAPCLDATELSMLVDLALRIERHFGSPQDVEWAIADGEPFVLQSRPVTAVAAREPAQEPASALSLVMKTFGARS